MNAETFCEHFATFADAPNGVEKLRGLILQLAIQGKLLPQVADDASAAAALLAQSEIAESNEVSELKRRTCSDVTTEIPWADTLPKSWAATTLDKVCSQITDGEHITPPRIPNGDVPLATAKNVRDGFMDLETTDFISLETAEKCWRRCQPNQNDILMVCVGATTGRLTVLKETVPFVIVRSVALFRPILTLVIPEYLALLLRSPFGQEQIWRSVKQSAQPCLYISRSRQLTVPLPPLAEQRRIVEKVDQLLGLCDELAARQAAQREKRQRLVGATLDRLVSTRNPAEFPTHAHRLRNHFDQLFDTPTTIPQLRQTILQLAVQGQLVPQDPNDEPASALLSRVETAQQVFATASKARQRTDLLPPTEDEQPYQSPDGWHWVRFGMVTNVVGGVTLGRKLEGRKLVSFPYLRVANVKRARLELDVIKEVEIPIEELGKYKLEPGDLLLTEGGDWDKVGRCAIWRGEIETCLHQNHVFRARLYTDEILSDWLGLYANSAVGCAYFQNAAKQTTNLASINMTQLRQWPVAIPPLAEQKRIVTKVTELLSLCDALEAKLTQAESASTQLISAAVHSLLNTE